MSECFLFSPAELAEITAGSWRGGNMPSVATRLSTDSRADNAGALFVPISGERFDGHDFIVSAIQQGAAAVMIADVKGALAEGLRVPVLLVADPLTAYQQIACAHRRAFPDLKIIGVTGSSGKTSTKEILRAILSGWVGADAVLATEGNTNNHVGVPSNLLRIRPHHRFAVIEMGTNHHGEIEVLSRMTEPDAALITCIGASHLEYFGTQAEVAREKSAIFRDLKKPGYCAVPMCSDGQNFIDDACSPYVKLTFGETADADMCCEYVSSALDGGTFRLHSAYSGKTVSCHWSIPGRHQARNAAAAALICERLGCDLETIGKALSATRLPGMRSKTTVRHGVTWVNDAYNANPESMKAALEWLSECVNSSETLLVLGDMREMGDASGVVHETVLHLVRERFSDAALVLVGPAMTAAAQNLNMDFAACFPDSVSAADRVQGLAKTKKTVFLKASRGVKLELTEPGDVA